MSDNEWPNVTAAVRALVQAMQLTPSDVTQVSIRPGVVSAHVLRVPGGTWVNRIDVRNYEIGDIRE